MIANRCLAALALVFAIQAVAQERLPEAVLQTGHAGVVKTAAFEPGGRFLATGGNDGQILFWDPATGRQLRAHRAGPLGTGLEAKAELAASKLPADFPLGTTAKPTIESIQFSADGFRMLALATPELFVDVLVATPTLNVWETASGRLLSRIELGQEDQSAAISPDGRLAASAGCPMSPEELAEAGAEAAGIQPVMALSLWDIDSGKRLKQFGGYKIESTAVRFSPDGKSLVTLCFEFDPMRRTPRGAPPPALPAPAPGKALEAPPAGPMSGPPALVHVWSVPSGKLIRSFAVGPGMDNLELSPQGDRMALWNREQKTTVEIWDLAKQAKLIVLPGHHPAFSADGSQVATINGKDTAFLFDLASGKQVRSFKLPGGEATAAAFSKEKMQLAVAGSQTIVFDAASGKATATLRSRHDPVKWLAVSPSGKYLAVGDCVWDMQTGARHGPLLKAPLEEFAAVFSGDERRLLMSNRPESQMFDFSGLFGASSSREPTVLVEEAEIATGKNVRKFTVPDKVNDRVDLAVSTAGDRMITCSRGGDVATWDLASGRKVKEMKIDGNGVYVAALPDGKSYAAFYGAIRTVWWDIRTGREISAEGRKPRPRGPDAGPTNVSADGRISLNQVPGGTSVAAVDARRPKRPTTFTPKLEFGETIGEVGFDEKNEQFAFANLHRTKAELVDAESGKTIRDLEAADVAAVVAAVSPNGELVAAGGDDGKTVVWNVASGKIAAQGTHDCPVASVDFDAAGKRLAIGLADGRIVVTRLGEKAALTMRGHDGPVHRAAFANGGKFLVSASGRDNTVRVWNAESGKELARLLGANERHDWIVISPDGFYDASEGALELVTFGQGGLELPKLDPSRRRPGLLAKVWRGETP